MTSRKQEKERLRQERIEAERRASADARKRLILGYVVAGILGIAVIGGAIYAISSSGGGNGSGGGDRGGDSANITPEFGFVPDIPVDEREGTTPPAVQNGDLIGAANVAGCDTQLDLKDEGNTHIEDLNRVIERETNPATSGDHYGVAASNEEPSSGALADGAFLGTPPENRVVHSLEHGRMTIQYSPDLPEEDQLLLKGLFDEQPDGLILFPNPDMPYDVAATAWTQLIGCDTFEGAPTIDALRAFRDQYLARGPEPVPITPQ